MLIRGSESCDQSRVELTGYNNSQMCITAAVPSRTPFQSAIMHLQIHMDGSLRLRQIPRNFVK